MTCIAAIEHDGRIWIGGDSASVTGWALTVRADEKVFITNPFIMGFTTSFRMGQLLRYNLTVKDQPEDMDDVRYMSTWFVDAVRTTLKTGGYATVEKGHESGGAFVVGYRGALYNVQSDFQVGRPVDGYTAIGCGEGLALGALYATSHLPPPERIKVALEAAERFSAGVRGPFLVLNFGPDSDAE